MRNIFILLVVLVIDFGYIFGQNNGKIYVNCDFGYKVYVDDNLEGISNNEGLFINNVDYGQHKLVVKKQGYKQFIDTNVFVKPGKTCEVFVGKLKKIEYYLYSFKEGIYVAPTDVLISNGILSKQKRLYVVLIFQPETSSYGKLILITFTSPKNYKYTDKELAQTFKKLSERMDYFEYIERNDNATGNYSIIGNKLNIELDAQKEAKTYKGTADFNLKEDLYFVFNISFFDQYNEPLIKNVNNKLSFHSLLFKDY